MKIDYKIINKCYTRDISNMFLFTVEWKRRLHREERVSLRERERESDLNLRMMKETLI